MISDSTRKLDYSVKMQKYMEAGVREYWIVDLKRKKVVCYAFEGEDAPDIAMYTFNDRVPVRIWKVGWKWILGRYQNASGQSRRKNDAEGPARGRQILYSFQV